MLRGVPLAAALAVLLPGVARAADIDAARAPASQLERTQTVQSLGTRFVRYRQEAGGVPVLGADAVLTAHAGPDDLLIDHTRARIARPGSPSLARRHALRIAVRATSAAAFRARTHASLAILPLTPGQRLVWRVL